MQIAEQCANLGNEPINDNIGPAEKGQWRRRAREDIKSPTAVQTSLKKASMAFKQDASTATPNPNGIEQNSQLTCNSRTRARQAMREIDATNATQGGFTKIKGIAAHLAKSERTIRSWVRRRLLPCYRPTPRTLLFKISECDAAMRKFRSGGVE